MDNSNLYLTADQVGTPTGGGLVTWHEYEAFKTLSHSYLWDYNILNQHVFYEDPWKWDQQALWALKNSPDFKPRLCHVYAGTFTESIKYLKSFGCKISYTAAAHDIAVSKASHEMLGIPFNYPHLTDPKLWARYLEGYLLADVLICPSHISADIKVKYGYKGRIEVIPHGVEISTTPLVQPPNTFTVGYLGAIGPDKGLIYLLQAWKELGYTDGSRLLFAGNESQHPFMRKMVIDVMGELSHTVGLLGWQENINTFYDGLTLYVQPSATEGFGIEVLEAMNRGRPALVSVGAGASDVVPETYKFRVGDYKELAAKIDLIKSMYHQRSGDWIGFWHNRIKDYSWNKIRSKYIKVWNSLLD